jgi:hypothetical protein
VCTRGCWVRSKQEEGRQCLKMSCHVGWSRNFPPFIFILSLSLSLSLSTMLTLKLLLGSCDKKKSLKKFIGKLYTKMAPISTSCHYHCQHYYLVVVYCEFLSLLSSPFMISCFYYTLLVISAFSPSSFYEVSLESKFCMLSPLFSILSNATKSIK